MMMRIQGSVGRGGVNRRPDVETVQKLLNQHLGRGQAPLKPDGLVGPRTISAIESVQSCVLHLAQPDGRVDPGGKTWNALITGKRIVAPLCLPPTGLTEVQKHKMIAAVERFPQLQGVGILYVGPLQSQIIRPSSLPKGLGTWIIVREVTPGMALRASDLKVPPSPADALKVVPRYSSNEALFQKVMLDLVGLGLIGVVEVTEAAAVPFTGGASLALNILTWAGASAAALQCGNDIGRFLNDEYFPGSNEQLDSESWYEPTIIALDAITLASGLAGLGEFARATVLLSRSTGKPLSAILKGMSRADRKRLAQEVAKSLKKAETRHQFIKLARAGKIPKLFTQKQVDEWVAHELLNSLHGVYEITMSAREGLIHKAFEVYIAEDSPE